MSVRKLRNGNRVHLRSGASGKNLRIVQDGSVNGQGGNGKWATFKVHRSGRVIRLQNIGNPEHWLRIDADGNLNGKGKGGRWTEFTIVKAKKGSLVLESAEHKKQGKSYHVGIKPDGSAKPGSKTGTGAHAQFTVEVACGKCGHGNKLRLRSGASGKNLRIVQDGSVNGMGGDGKWATFTIHNERGILRLQNVGNPEHWLRIDADGNLNGKGKGGKWTEFVILRPEKGQIILRSAEHARQGKKYHVGIKPDGSAKPGSKTGTGAHSRFIIQRC